MTLDAPRGALVRIRARRDRRSSWVAYALADQLGTTCAAFLQRAVAWLRARGITTLRVMSDNGSGYV